MVHYIYKTVNLVNGHYYIGMHIGKLSDNYLGSGYLLKQAIKKYGKDNFKKEVLVICENEEELRIWEKKIIDLKITDSDCYNIAPGGQGGNVTKHFTEEERKKIRGKATKAVIEWNKNNPTKVKERQVRQKQTLNSNLDQLRTNIKIALSKKTSEEKQHQHSKITAAKLTHGHYSIFRLVDKDGNILIETIGAETIAKCYNVSANGIRLAAKHGNPIKRGNLAECRVYIINY